MVVPIPSRSLFGELYRALTIGSQILRNLVLKSNWLPEAPIGFQRHRMAQEASGGSKSLELALQKVQTDSKRPKFF